jgi:hypothetical protein
MDFTLREEYWIKFCMKFIAVISLDNYYSQFCSGLLIRIDKHVIQTNSLYFLLSGLVWLKLAVIILIEHSTLKWQYYMNVSLCHIQ